ncbi:MAG TPA: glycerate kinase [Solirubrobacteraceae bacterium]|nr:glycerate kinase [Solirubrobacteraceae bacterium]
MTPRIPDRLLVAGGPFAAALPASRAAAAIGRGLRAGGLPAPDLCPIDHEDAGDVRALLDSLDFDVRMRRARAVVVVAARLQERTLAGSLTFEIATRARQAGVPAYAVTAENTLNAFDARILDLQVILEARTARALTAAGRKLAGLV